VNELQMLDFIKDVLWKAAVESHKETSYSELGKSNLKKKQDDISRAITLLELLKDPYVKNLKKNIELKNF